jgi:ArsR family transcriptional regulator
MPGFDHTPHELLRLLAEEIRLRILCLLQVHEELCVCDMVDILKLPQPTVSRHLMLLKQAGLLRVRRTQPWAYYSLDRGDDVLWNVAQGLLAVMRTRSPQIARDIELAGSIRRPNCVGREST